jgi:hypothetical protein
MSDTIKYRVYNSSIEASFDMLNSLVTVSFLACHHDTSLVKTRLDLEIPYNKTFEELINNISKLVPKPNVTPEEISIETVEEVYQKIDLNISRNTVAKIITHILNTDIKLVKKKNYKVTLKLQKNIDKDIEQHVLAVSQEDAFRKAHEKMKNDWPSYKIVDTKSEEA